MIILRTKVALLCCALLPLSATLVQARPLVTGKKTLLIAIGDSLTAGAPFFESPIEYPPDGKGDPQGQYVYWMASRMPQWKVLNWGVSGETSAQIRARFEEALKQGPRYIIILAGTNDITQGLPPEKVADNLLWMYETAKAQTVMPVAVTLPPFDVSTTLEAAKIDVLNRWIRKQADLMRIPIADADKALRSAENPHKLSGTLDGRHPDVGGYRTLGLKLIEAIEPIEKAWR